MAEKSSDFELQFFPRVANNKPVFIFSFLMLIEVSKVCFPFILVEFFFEFSLVFRRETEMNKFKTRNSSFIGFVSDFFKINSAIVEFDKK